MGLKSFNPYTASRRFITVLDKSHITKETPEKSLLAWLVNASLTAFPFPLVRLPACG